MHKEFFALLKSEHKMVKNVMKQMEETTAPKERVNLLNQFSKLIEPHMEGEEKFFYPALLRKNDSQFEATEGEVEHRMAKILYNEIKAMDTKDKEWAPKVKVLREMLEHHIKEEERELFDKAKDNIPENKMKQIMEQYIENRETMERRF